MARRTFSYPLSLAIVVATLIAVTGGWIAWWNYRAGVTNIRTLADGLFDQIAREAARETSSFVMRAPPAAATLAGLDKLDAKTFEAVLRANPSFTWVSYSQPDGTFTGVYRPSTGAIRVNQSRIVDGRTILDEYELLPDGAQQSVRHDDDSKYDPRTRPYYALATAATDGVWTPPYVFEGQNVPGITYALAHRVNGQLAGVLTIDFDLARLTELARELVFSKNGRVVLISDQTVLAHPTMEVVRMASGEPELITLAALDDPAIRAQRAAGATTRFDLAGEPHLARTLAIAMPGGPAWQVLAYAPESDFTVALRGRVVSSLLISLIAVLVAVLVAWLLARRVSGPLTVLAGEMEKAGELHLEDTPEHPSMFREIDMMNTALTKMKGGLRSFARYVPRDLVRTLVRSGLDAELTGELRQLTIFFSDLEGFTSLAETKAPDELVRFLGQYFDDISKLIASERGTVDKYMGDGIMAFWGAPTRFEDHATRACVASLKCQRRVEELSARGVSLRTRIGLATGEVLVGNIGSTERMNYTVMGDIANLASRIEGLNKQYGTQLMISEATYEQARATVIARPLDVVAVKGRTQGVPVYELLALVEDHDTAAETLAVDSTRALDAYLARNFHEAAEIWSAILERIPGDIPATLMRDRALGFAAAPPPPEWTGVTVATEK